ncbi:MAG: WecB/TagA/CpsF family glycosyltransferase [Clostridium sp.]|uniref:WecB/TagA/CpsF family glycosyltransferase n=1 Tax=Clostridium sp. TaxID=1506 RepID=UPI002FC9AA9D
MSEKYLGVEVSTLSMDEVLLKVDSTISNNEKAFIVAINPEKIMKAQEDKALLELINSADIKIPDGSGVVLASKIKKGKIKERVTGIDLFKNICSVGATREYKIFLLGAKKDVIERASKNLKDEIKGLNIVGTQDGYFTDNNKVIDMINASEANIVFVAMGSPRQEKWIIDNKDKINANVFMGVGGSLDVISGDINRAPKWMQSCNMEWAYRLYKEPTRISRMKALPKFMFKALKKTR